MDPLAPPDPHVPAATATAAAAPPRGHGGADAALGGAARPHAARRIGGRERSDDANGCDDDSDGSDGSDIVGDDRLHYLAMVAATAAPLPAPPQALPADDVIAAVGPRNRAECGRRCGSDGFCDPSSLSGCGGAYCLGIQSHGGDRV